MDIAVKQIERLASDEHAASGTVWKETKVNIWGLPPNGGVAATPYGYRQIKKRSGISLDVEIQLRE